MFTKKLISNIRSLTIFLTLLALTFSSIGVTPAFAAPSFTVNSILDEVDDNPGDGICHTASNTCTLRAAIMEANRASGVGATIMLPAGPYTLTIPAAGADGEENGDLNLTTPASGNPVITITGAGAGTTIIDANQIDRVFSIQTGRTASISGVTIRNGYTLGDGGGIFSSGALTVTNSTLSGNFATYGGGIDSSGTLGTLTITNSTLSGNSANYGGGINNGSTLTITNSTLSGNSASYGGGIYNYGTLTVTNSTLSGNSAYNDGGGICNLGFLTVINSTLAGNSANGDGGGIYNRTGDANVYNTSIVFNGADADADPNGGKAGGVFNYGNAAVFNLRNTLVAGNYVSGAPVDDDCSGTLNSYGRNLFGAVTGCTVNTASGSWTTLNSLNTLGTLQNNGGPTWTVALLPGSNAIDGGDPVSGCTDYNGNTIATDQRGFARVVGVRCDIGAYEGDVTPPNTAIDSTPSDPSNDNTPTFTFSGDDGAGIGIASFMCKMDGGSYAACATPFTSPALSNGSHTFYVYAIDNDANADATPASYTWTITTVHKLFLPLILR